jgi:hypothetical protein
MKRLGLLLAMILLIGSQSLDAQVKAFRFGFSIAPTVSWMNSNTENYESSGSSGAFSWGFISDIALTDNYFIKTGIGMDFLGGNLDFDENYTYSPQGMQDTTIFASVERHFSTKYLEIPLLIKMKTNQFGKLAYFGEFGLETGFRLSAKATDRVNNDFDYTKNLVEEKEINFFKESLVFAAGVEYSIDESTSLIGGLRFNNGFTNVLKGDNNISQKEKNAMFLSFQFTVGVMF